MLESLSLKKWKLGNLNISSFKLKHLELSCFDNDYTVRTKRYEISAPNLVTFGDGGRVGALHLKCVPCLSDFYVRDQDDPPFFTKLDMHLSYITQLKKLKLNLGILLSADLGALYPLELPELMKLEEFEVQFLGYHGDSLLWPTVFIKAAPFLHRFAVEMDVLSCFIGSRIAGDQRRIKEATKCRHRFLKVVEIIGFGGSNREIELVQHLIDIGSESLERVAIDTQLPMRKHHYDHEAEYKKMCAQSLEQGLESSVDFVVR